MNFTTGELVWICVRTALVRDLAINDRVVGPGPALTVSFHPFNTDWFGVLTSEGVGWVNARCVAKFESALVT